MTMYIFIVIIIIMLRIIISVNSQSYYLALSFCEVIVNSPAGLCILLECVNAYMPKMYNYGF